MIAPSTYGESGPSSASSRPSDQAARASSSALSVGSAHISRDIARLANSALSPAVLPDGIDAGSAAILRPKSRAVNAKAHEHHLGSFHCDARLVFPVRRRVGSTEVLERRGIGDHGLGGAEFV